MILSSIFDKSTRSALIIPTLKKIFFLKANSGLRVSCWMYVHMHVPKCMYVHIFTGYLCVRFTRHVLFYPGRAHRTCFFWHVYVGENVGEGSLGKQVFLELQRISH